MDLPKSGRNRLEEYLLYLCGKGAVFPLTPRNRLECFLDYLCKHAGGGGGGSITVDSALDPTSENPVQNKLVYSALSEKIDREASAVMVTMFANGNSVACFKGFAEIYALFNTQQKAYFILVKSQTDYQMFKIDRVDRGNQTIYLSSVVGGVLSQIVLTPGGTNTMTGTLTTIDLNLQNAQGVSF